MMEAKNKLKQELAQAITKKLYELKLITRVEKAKIDERNNLSFLSI
ncbi:MAG: hypothetical protein RR207_05930 [Clostridia bacterium]